ncbi:MAG: acyltransferase [Clostridia bacterium]|jgi:peptidoglycan/LPS O-acetylase OafA/YrhL|nr:acyltransferase [Clostridia bacterium]
MKDKNNNNYAVTCNMLQKRKEEHNGIIGFWKFAFCIMIIFLHIGQLITKDAKFVFAAGSIGVEFFFLVSGYFLGKKALNYKKVENEELGKETYQYIIKKIKKFFPWMLITYVISVLVMYFVKHFQTHQVINSIWDILFLKQSGIKYDSVMDITWYISVMIIAMNILYPIILKFRKNFVYIIAPAIVIFIGGYIAHRYGNIVSIDVWTGLVYKCFLRGFFEISLGVILYEVTQKLKSINFTKIAKTILTCIEIIGFTSIFIVVNIKNAHNKYDFIMILILSICISIAFSEKTLLLKFCNNKFVYFLEKLSLPMYLNQIWIITLIKYIFQRYSLNYYQYCLVVLIIDIVFSIIAMQLVKIIKSNIGKIKKVFISTNEIKTNI